MEINMRDICDRCYITGIDKCKYCDFGNPCYRCEDYDIENETCKSHGGCALINKEKYG